MIIEVPNLRAVSLKIFKGSWDALQYPFHKFIFSAESLKTILKANGFKVLNLSFFSPSQPMLWLFSFLNFTRGLFPSKAIAYVLSVPFLPVLMFMEFLFRFSGGSDIIVLVGRKI